MSEVKISSALVQGYIDCGVMPIGSTAVEGGAPFVPVVDVPWGRLTGLPSDRYKDGLSQSDSTTVTGILQIDIFYPKGTGRLPLLQAADTIMAFFDAHSELVFDGQRVKITKAERSSVRAEEIWQSIFVSVYYRSNTP